MNVAEPARPMAARLATASTAGPGGREPDGEELGLPRILALLAGFVLVWTLYFAITEAPVAIKHDMAEAYAWGRQFQLGYNQHPPFWAWICGIWFRVFPRTLWAFALLSSLNAGIGLWGAWAAIGDFATGRTRMAAWVLLLLTPLYTFYAYKYNANIIFLSLWPWTLHWFMRSVQTRRTGAALAFGLWVGLAMLSKYYALILIGTCFLAALQHPRRRAYFTSRAPWISAATAAVLLAPHVWWLVANRAPPLRYLDTTTGWAWPWVRDHAANAFFSVVGMNLAPMLLVGAVAWRFPRSREQGDGTTTRILATLTLTPLLVTIVSGLILRNTITSEMMIGTFPLLPLLAIRLAGGVDTARLWRTGSRLALVVMFGALAVAPGFAFWRSWYSPARMKQSPFQEVAVVATRMWHQRTGLPLDYVGGTYWYDNETAFYSPDRPHSFAQFKYSENLWVTPGKLARHGLLSICVAGDKACLDATARFVTPQTTRADITLAHRFWGHTARPVSFVLTFIPPRG